MILEREIQSTSFVRNGAGFERDSVILERPEYSFPLVAGLLMVAIRNQGSLGVLDFGGALGSSYYQHRMFLDGLASVRWSVVEQPHLVSVGRERFTEGALQFFQTIAECLAAEKPDVLLLSGVLMYLESP